MGGLCSKGSAVDKSPSDTTLGPGRVLDHHEHGLVKEEKKTVAGDEAVAKRAQEQLQPPQQEQPISVSQTAMPEGAVNAAALPWDGVPPLARLPSQKSGMGVAKASVAKASFQYFLLW
ncbi:hypothetical protein PR202_ga08889 [Eleusine coracana subsp. coracana]|uniref:Uncharacterized protein n=1 Tax=Eleusine coracana subsp. coracana TaxID=191504 RepID=A0AAV5C1F4_ELECO|nr:hypothetical protein PR202_ga08889 [Eleusine coracana subsp. coracana]